MKQVNSWMIHNPIPYVPLYSVWEFFPYGSTSVKHVDNNLPTQPVRRRDRDLPGPHPKPSVTPTLSPPRLPSLLGDVLSVDPLSTST